MSTPRRPQMPDLGELRQLEVWHDNGGFGAAWHLDYIEVQNTKTRQVWDGVCVCVCVERGKSVAASYPASGSTSASGFSAPHLRLAHRPYRGLGSTSASCSSPLSGFGLHICVLLITPIGVWAPPTAHSPSRQLWSCLAPTAHA
eukprot:364711-Chlamydomonas_euryale.AAC.4